MESGSTTFFDPTITTQTQRIRELTCLQPLPKSMISLRLTGNRRNRLLCAFLVPGIILLCCLVFQKNDSDSAMGQDQKLKDDESNTKFSFAENANQARSRAKILFETLHGTLQVMHRDFFRKDDSINIPSRSLEDVFRELEKQHKIELSWIAVDLEPMNIDNAPETPFEKLAAAKLKTGLKEFESIKPDRYQYAGRINIGATCLSCHAPRRNNNDERAAGLIIQMPIQQKAKSPSR